MFTYTVTCMYIYIYIYLRKVMGLHVRILQVGSIGAIGEAKHTVVDQIRVLLLASGSLTVLLVHVDAHLGEDMLVRLEPPRLSINRMS